MTGWASKPQTNAAYATQPQDQGYYGQQQGYNQGAQYIPPPSYGQQQQPQQYGVAEPQPVYGGGRDMGADTYAPPVGPPPGKKADGIIH